MGIHFSLDTYCLLSQSQPSSQFILWQSKGFKHPLTPFTYSLLCLLEKHRCSPQTHALINLLVNGFLPSTTPQGYCRALTVLLPTLTSSILPTTANGRWACKGWKKKKSLECSKDVIGEKSVKKCNRSYNQEESPCFVCFMSFSSYFTAQ